MSAIGRALLRRAGLELTEGEDVLWVGRPEERAAVRHAMRVAIVSLVAIAVTGLGYVFDIWNLLIGPPDSPMRQALTPTWNEIIGGVLVFLALVVVGSMLWAKWLTSETWYAVSNRRLLFLHGRTAASVWLGQYDLITIQMVDHGDGTGDLLFRRTRAEYDPAAGRVGGPRPDLFDELGQHIAGESDEQEMDTAFVGIRNAPAVRELILRAYRTVR